MTDTTQQSSLKLNVPPGLTLFFFALLAAAAIISPRTSPLAFIATGVISAIYLLRMGEPIFTGRIVTPLTAAIAAFWLYCAINAAWSISVPEAYGKVGLLLGIFAGIYFAWRTLSIAREEDVRTVAYALLIGLAIGAAYLLIEILTDQYIRRLIYNLLPSTRPSSTKHLILDGERVVGIYFSDLNRSVAFILFAVWPVVLVISALWEGARRVIALSVFFLATVLIAVMSIHETSQIALVAGAIVFALGRVNAKACFWLVAGAWTAAVLFIVPPILLAFNAGLHRAEWVPETGRARIILWHETASKIADAPILGIGIRSTKALDRIAKRDNTLERLEGENYPRHVGRHAHNLYLQTWFELGLLGALFLLAAGLSLIRWIALNAGENRPIAYATFATAASIAAFSWGMWQGWYLYGLALSAVLVLHALRLCKDRCATS